MNTSNRWKRLAGFLKKYPWLVQMAFPIRQRLLPRYTVGVTGIILNDQHQVLLVEHVFHPTVPWGLPGGGLDAREDPREGLLRELREELQLTVEIIAPFWVEYTTWMHLDITFLCRAISEPGALSFELTAARYFDLDALPDLTDYQLRALEHLQSHPEIETH